MNKPALKTADQPATIKQPVRFMPPAPAEKATDPGAIITAIHGLAADDRDSVHLAKSAVRGYAEATGANLSWLGTKPMLPSRAIGSLASVLVDEFCRQPTLLNAQTYAALHHFYTKEISARGRDRHQRFWSTLADGILDPDSPIAASRWYEVAVSALVDTMHSAPDEGLEHSIEAAKAVLEHHAPAADWTGDQSTQYQRNLARTIFSRLWHAAAADQAAPWIGANLHQLAARYPVLADQLPLHRDETIDLARAVAETALAQLPAGSPQRSRVLERLPLDWMSPQEALKEIRRDWRRVQGVLPFENTSLEHTRAAIEGWLQMYGSDYEPVADMVGVDELVKDAAWLEKIGKTDLLVASPGHKLQQLLAHVEDRGLAREVLAKAVAATAREYRGADRPKAFAQILGLTVEDPRGAYERLPTLGPRDLADLFRRAPPCVLTGQGDTEPDVRYGGGAWLSHQVARRSGRQRWTQEEYDDLLAACVESGAVQIPHLSKKDLRAEVLGGVLKKQPERLAEVTDLAAFRKLAKALSIPVEIPENEARRRRDKALDAVATARAPARRARAPGA